MATSIDVFGTGGVSYGSMRAWIGRGTTVDGVVTVYPTDNGLASGNAFFGSLESWGATPILGTSVAKDVPKCAFKSISSDKKTVEINVTRGVTIALLGLHSIQFVPDGTEVAVQLWGFAPQ